ncbi:hypothetical protein JOD45_001798 [Scopulibacillus daqui]|uniref:Uncharacterized protein n=1 Tax=Scopulibacillus daqui TaxID=1469162 RepID=A0ABS2Q0U7_9BACL|nr:hypothetical protein [Scopulibacillus daqui]
MSEFVLRTNQRWIGASKWIVRSLRAYDESFADQFVQAFDNFYRTGDKGLVVQLANDVLAPYGGRCLKVFQQGRSALQNKRI